MLFIPISQNFFFVQKLSEICNLQIKNLEKILLMCSCFWWTEKSINFFDVKQNSKE